jgi:HTH-type transcriptional regulator/antitoxin HigA
MFLDILPRPISCEDEAARIEHVIDELVDVAAMRDLTSDERDFLNLLGNLLYAWEEDRYDWPHASPLELLRALMEDTETKQADLVGPVFPSSGIASEVLKGKRRLTYAYVERLARYFHTSPAVFFDV